MKYLVVNILLYLTVKCIFCVCKNGTNETSHGLVTSNVSGTFYRIPKTTTCRFSSVKPSIKKNLLLLGLERIESHSQHLRKLVLDVLIYEAKNELNEGDIAQVYRLEAKNEDTDSRKPPILIRFREERIRDMVFKNRFNLNNTRFKLNIDLSKKNYHRHQELQPLKQKIKDLGMRCHVFNGRLFVDGKEYSKEQIDKLIAKAGLITSSTPLKSGFVIRTRHSLSWKK